MKIRKFRQKDAETCSKIIFECVDSAKKINKQNKNFLKKIYTPEGLINQSRKFDLFVVEKNKKIIGMGKLEKNLIGTIYFDPLHHREGGGRLIMEKLEKLAKRRKIKKVYVNSLFQTVTFYKKLGFEKVEEEKKPIRNIRMKKILK